ncbi:MAG TPA: metalloregulator ArsR/SmtB family transcription factor [Burkholderiales bacterium]|nr:metalloregulator ArsR/SmtB family transcription factor [Burkholderiales bacterium]
MTVNPQDRVFAALASAPRRRVIAFLAQTALSTSDLAQRFGMSAPAVSRHLAVLLEAGLVTAERQGQRVLYRLQRDALLAALAGLASVVDGPLRRVPQMPLVPREAL